MREIYIFSFVLLISFTCANCTRSKRTNLNTNVAEHSTPAPTATPPDTPDATDDTVVTKQSVEEIPKEFASIDFNNFRYESFLTGRHFRLRDGEAEGEGTWSSSFSAVAYVDLNNDVTKEALVELWEQTVGGSTNGHRSYYIYGVRGGKPRMIWKFHMGSESYCGLRNVQIVSGKIILEAYSICRFSDDGLVVQIEDIRDFDLTQTDVNVKYTTRFTLAWNGRSLTVEKREVKPYERDNIGSDPAFGSLRDFVQIPAP